MSNNRIDHAAEARKSLEWLGWAGENTIREDGPLVVAAAQVHATLALVEQVRVANLIALANSRETTGGSAGQALSALTGGESGVWGTVEHLSLRPDIAAALGVER